MEKLTADLLNMFKLIKFYILHLPLIITRKYTGLWNFISHCASEFLPLCKLVQNKSISLCCPSSQILSPFEVQYTSWYSRYWLSCQIRVATWLNPLFCYYFVINWIQNSYFVSLNPHMQE